MERTCSFRLSEKTYAELSMQAAREKRKTSELLRDATRLYLSKFSLDSGGPINEETLLREMLYLRAYLCTLFESLWGKEHEVRLRHSARKKVGRALTTLLSEDHHG